MRRGFLRQHRIKGSGVAPGPHGVHDPGPAVVGEYAIGDDGCGVAGQDGVGDDRLTRLGPRRPPGGVEAAGGGERGDGAPGRLCGASAVLDEDVLAVQHGLVAPRVVDRRAVGIGQLGVAVEVDAIVEVRD